MGFNVIHETENYSHIGLSGRLDASGMEGLETRFMNHIAAHRKHTLIDFSGVTFIASMGIRLLIRTAQTLQLAGGKLVLIDPQPLVVNALEIAGVTRLMLIAPNTIDAIAMLANE